MREIRLDPQGEYAGSLSCVPPESPRGALRITVAHPAGLMVYLESPAHTERWLVNNLGKTYVRTELETWKKKRKREEGEVVEGHMVNQNDTFL